MFNNFTLIVLLSISYAFSKATPGSYVNVSEEIMVTPTSAAMAGADMSISSGSSVESTPGNLPFDSLNRLALSYAGYFHQTFSTSMLTWSGQPRKNLGVSVLAGYVYIPGILDTRESISDDNGGLAEAKISVYSASKIFFRAGIGQRFDLTPSIALGAGIAVNAKRFRLPETGYGIGLDAGLKTFFSKPGISLALKLENMTSSYIYWNESFQERSYPHLRAGIGWERSIPYIYGIIRAAYSSPDLFANEGVNDISVETTGNDNIIETPSHYELYDKPSLMLSQGKLGLEYTLLRKVAFRAGVSNGKFGFGAGLMLFHERAGLDFAYIAHSLAETYQLSARYSW